MMLESFCHLESVFLTLTYAKDPVSVDKSHLQRFLKRLRRQVEPRHFRYFAVGEYGGTYGRPHYHAMLFGLGLCDEEVIAKSWKLGFIQVSEFNRSRCRYIAKYTIKKLTSPDAFLGGKSPEFAIMSRRPSLGRTILESVIRSAQQSGICYNDGPSGIESERVKLTTLPGCVRLDGKIHLLDQNFRSLFHERLGAPVRNSLKRAVVRDELPLEHSYLELEGIEQSRNDARKALKRRGML